MFFVFFCVNGNVGELRLTTAPTARPDKVASTRALDADIDSLAAALDKFPGAVAVVANDWPFYFGLDIIRRECGRFGTRIVNVVNTVGGTKEQAIFHFMSRRSEPYVVLASTDFEFTERSAQKRIDIAPKTGIGGAELHTLRRHLRQADEQALKPVSTDEVLRATVGASSLRRARQIASPLQFPYDKAFQRRLGVWRPQ